SLCRLISFVSFNGECARIFPQNIRVAFVHPIHGSHARAALQGVLQGVHLLRVADRIYFDAPVVQIPYVAGNAQAQCRPLGEKAEPHSLHAAGHEKSLGLCFHGYTSRSDLFLQPRDCSKGPGRAVGRASACRGGMCTVVVTATRTDRLKPVLLGRSGFLGTSCCTILADCIQQMEAFPMIQRSNVLAVCCALAVILAAPLSLRAQAAGPMEPPESTKFPTPPAPGNPEPPTLAPDEIIRRFAAKEDEMVRAIRGYTFQKDL